MQMFNTCTLYMAPICHE